MDCKALKAQLAFKDQLVPLDGQVHREFKAQLAQVLAPLVQLEHRALLAHKESLVPAELAQLERLAQLVNKVMLAQLGPLEHRDLQA